MADDFALVRIVRVVDPNTNNPSIRVKQLVVSDGNAFSGDIQVLNSANGTDVKFGLAKHLVDESGRQFAFKINKTVPICVEDHTNGPPPTKCMPGQMPEGFSVSALAADSFVLSLPKLSAPDAVYKYTLFMEFKNQQGVWKDVTIDPKIKNGGVSTLSAVEKPVIHQIAGLGLTELFAAAILLFAAGGFLGWVLAGGRRP